MFKVSLRAFSAAVVLFGNLVRVSQTRLVVECNLGLGGTSNTYIECLGPCSAQFHFGVIPCTCLKMACKFNTAGHTAKQ